MKHLFKIFLAFIALVISHNGAAFIIKGKATAFKNNVVSIFIYDDYISMKEVQIASSIIDKNGDFNLSGKTDKTVKAFIRIGNIQSAIFIEPEKNYQVEVMPPSESQAAIKGKPVFVASKINPLEPNDLNNQIAAFNQSYDRFLEVNYPLIIKKAAKPQIDKFKKDVEKKFGGNKDSFFRNYIIYSLASLEQLTSVSKRQLFELYIKNKPVLNDHPEYMQFLKDFYSKYLLLKSQSKSGTEIQSLVNSKKDIDGLKKFLIQDKFVDDEALAELILAFGLFEVYHHEDYKEQSVEYLLKKLSQGAKDEVARKTAGNIHYKLTKFKAGNPVPDWEALTVNGEKVKLSSFRGKYVYLTFFTSWSTTSVQEMKTLSRIYEKYKSKVVIVSVSLDQKRSDFVSFANKNPYPWTMLHYGGNEFIVNAYEAFSVPVYFMIDPDGKFYQAPADSPSGGIERLFHQATSPAPAPKSPVGR
jgi:peroxiredoxin